jgi:hypothetical protein
MKCSFHPEDSRLVELDRTEIENYLKLVSEQQVRESLERLIGEGRVAASKVLSGYHLLMTKVGRG